MIGKQRSDIESLQVNEKKEDVRQWDGLQEMKHKVSTIGDKAIERNRPKAKSTKYNENTRQSTSKHTESEIAASKDKPVPKSAQ